MHLTQSTWSTVNTFKSLTDQISWGLTHEQGHLLLEQVFQSHIHHGIEHFQGGGYPQLFWATSYRQCTENRKLKTNSLIQKHLNKLFSKIWAGKWKIFVESELLNWLRDMAVIKKNPQWRRIWNEERWIWNYSLYYSKNRTEGKRRAIECIFTF